MKQSKQGIPEFDICIRGAGIVGYTLALHLANKKLRVALVKPAPAGMGIDIGTDTMGMDVRAYALNQASRNLLEAVRCWPNPEYATPVLNMKIHGDAGGHLGFNVTQTDTEALNWIVDVPVLENLLADAVRFQPLIEIMEILHTATPPSATLTLVCEGRHSRTRQALGVGWDVQPYHQWALATRVDCELPHRQIAEQWLDRGEILAFLPLEGAEGKRCAVVWSVSPERAKELENASAEDFCNALQIANHNTLGALTLVGNRKSWLLQHALTQRWSGDSWALAGDSAHNMHPLAGQGLNRGLADAESLIRIVGDRSPWRSVNDPKLLRRYARERSADFALMGHGNDFLQQILTHPHPVLQTLRNWGMNRFERNNLLKTWVARRAMGVTGSTTESTLI